MSNVEFAMLTQMNKGWNRWDATRQENSSIQAQDATGLEGYFEGMDLTPEEVANKIAELGILALKSMKNYHSQDAGYMGKVWKVAKGEKYDLAILAELNACLLANLARLRMQVLPQVNRKGADFRTNIANQVQAEKVYYHGNGTLEEHGIAVPKNTSELQKRAISVTDATFTTDELRRGYAFMKLLGKAGYPPLLLALREKR